MKVATFSVDFKLGTAQNKSISIQKNRKYIFSDFVLKQFIDDVVKKSGIEIAKTVIKSIEEIDSIFPILDLSRPIEELKKVNSLIIIRTGGIGDLLALSNVAKLATHIFRDVLKNKKFKVFFITDQKYSAVFKYFEQMVTPIYYFFEPVDKILSKHDIFGKKDVRCIYFEGVIEEREDNWFDLQMERLNIRKFALLDQIDKSFLVKNPKLVNVYTNGNSSNVFLKKNNIDGIDKIFRDFKYNETKTILIHHRASAWIRSFNLGDTILSLDEYFKSAGFDNYRIITLPRNYTKSDNQFIEDIYDKDKSLFSKIVQIKTENLHQFFYIIANSNYVISSDTAAFHFKEGIAGNALGLYSSFPSRMRTATYVNTKSYDIVFKDCEFVCDKNNYIGCTSHFKTPYEICVHVANKYRDILKSEHHFLRGNRIPKPEFIKDLENFVNVVGVDSLMEQGIFQYAPCLSSLWNPLFKEQLLKIYEKENLIDIITSN